MNLISQPKLHSELFSFTSKCLLRVLQPELDGIGCQSFTCGDAKESIRWDRPSTGSKPALPSGHGLHIPPACSSSHPRALGSPSLTPTDLVAHQVCQIWFSEKYWGEKGKKEAKIMVRFLEKLVFLEMTFRACIFIRNNSTQFAFTNIFSVFSF